MLICMLERLRGVFEGTETENSVVNWTNKMLKAADADRDFYQYEHNSHYVFVINDYSSHVEIVPIEDFHKTEKGCYHIDQPLAVAIVYAEMKGLPIHPDILNPPIKVGDRVYGKYYDQKGTVDSVKLDKSEYGIIYDEPIFKDEHYSYSNAIWLTKI